MQRTPAKPTSVLSAGHAASRDQFSSAHTGPVSFPHPHAQVRAAVLGARDALGNGEHMLACVAIGSWEMQVAFEDLLRHEADFHFGMDMATVDAAGSDGAAAPGGAAGRRRRPDGGAGPAPARKRGRSATGGAADPPEEDDNALDEGGDQATTTQGGPSAAAAAAPAHAAAVGPGLAHSMQAWMRVHADVREAFTYANHLSRLTFDGAEPVCLDELRARLSPSSLERRRRVQRCEALLGRRMHKAVLKGRSGTVKLQVDLGRPFSKADHLKFLLQEEAWEEATREKLQLREQFCANLADLIRALVATPPPNVEEARAGRARSSQRAPLFAAMQALWASMATEGDVEGVARWRAATDDGGGARGGPQGGGGGAAGAHGGGGGLDITRRRQGAGVPPIWRGGGGGGGGAWGGEGAFMMD